MQQIMSSRSALSLVGQRFGNRLFSSNAVSSLSSSSSKLVVGRNNLIPSTSLLSSFVTSSDASIIGRCSIPNTSAVRSFSSGAELSGTDELIDLLTREHSEEIQNENHLMSDELKEYYTKLEKEWKIVDHKTDAMLRMYKTLPNGSKIQLFTHCQDTTANMEDFMDEEDDNDEAAADGNKDETNPEEESEAAVKFTVTITKGGKTVIFTNLTDKEGSFKIQSCAVSTSEDIDKIVKEGGTVSIEQYQGPEFMDLAEDVYDAFHVYLHNVVGVDATVSEFLVMYSEHKEENQYIQFLENVKNVLQN